MPNDMSIIYLGIIYLCFQLQPKIIDSNHNASNQYNKAVFKSTGKKKKKLSQAISGKGEKRESNFRMKLKVKKPKQKT